MPREALLAALVMSLMFTSLIIGFINLAANDKFPTDLFGTNNIEGALYYQGSNPQGSSILMEQNYSSTNGFNQNISRVYSGNWLQDPTGFTTTTDQESIIALDNVIPVGTVYTVKYTVDNSANVPYYLFGRLSNIVGILGQQGSQDIHNIKVLFDSTGIHLVHYEADFGINPYSYHPVDTYFYPLPNAQATNTGGSEITLIVDNQQDTYVSYKSGVTVIKDGVTLFSYNTLRDEYPNTYSFYGGFGSDYTGFTVTKVSANFLTKVGNQPGYFSTWLDQLINEILSFFAGVSQFITGIALFLGYSISSDLCPLWLSSIIIVPQIVAIAYMIAQLFRGT